MEETSGHSHRAQLPSSLACSLQEDCEPKLCLRPFGLFQKRFLSTKLEFEVLRHLVCPTTHMYLSTVAVYRSEIAFGGPAFPSQWFNTMDGGRRQEGLLPEPCAPM